jgi:hypothetical protein
MTEVSSHVVRIGCTVKVRRMALVAIRIVQLVVAVGMTRLALHGNVRPGQREQCCAVIKC